MRRSCRRRASSSSTPRRGPTTRCASWRGTSRAATFDLGAATLSVQVTKRRVIIFTLMAYVFFSYDLFKLAIESSKNTKVDQSPWVLITAVAFPFFVFFSIFLALLFAHFYLVQLGSHNEFASVNLKYGTGILLSLYVVTFAVASFICTRHSTKSTQKGKDLYKEVKFFFYRLDLPLFLSFSCLFVFTSGVLGREMMSFHR
jgi:hypothetical protein